MKTRHIVAGLYNRIKVLIARIFQRVKHIWSYIYRFTGYLLIYVGSAMIKKDRKYLLITDTIENLYSSIDVIIHVTGYVEEPLFVRFAVEINSSVDHVVDWKYFTTELIYQLGCNLSDIVIHSNKSNSNEKNKVYNIDITRTAITNLEKGTSPGLPHVYEETRTDVVMKKAIALSKTEIITPDMLEEKLGINSYRAETIYNQLLQAGVLDKKSNKTVN